MTEREHVQDLNRKAQKAIRKAVAKALLAHEAAGVPAAIWKNGKVAILKSKSTKRK